MWVTGSESVCRSDIKYAPELTIKGIEEQPVIIYLRHGTVDGSAAVAAMLKLSV